MHRLANLENRINALGSGLHHDVYHFLQHGIKAIREEEAKIQDENKLHKEFDMKTVHHTVNRSVEVLVTVLEKTIEDWEHHADKTKKNFEDGVE